MVVKEGVSLDREPGARAVPALFKVVDLNEDFGRIEPHQERFPAAVEAALFAVLLVPWEDWVDMHDIDWRGFRVPWIYTLEDDIFVRPQPPPSPDTLSWEPQSFQDWDGEEIEGERPMCMRLDAAAAASAPTFLNDMTWSELVLACRSPLFETPIAHFLVHGFLTERMDEFLAHITTMEAALGLQSDYLAQPRSARHRSLRSTARVATRVSGLLGTKGAGEDYRRLFEIRSEFLHGRTMGAVSSDHRNLARNLARKVVSALVTAALVQPAVESRDTYLETLVDKGMALC
jgi:hypothetical protein